MLVGKERVYDQELIDARVIGLLANSREINTDNFDVLAYELPAYPPSMFNPGGKMKITKSKSTLKLQVVISQRNCPTLETFVYDVSALLCVLTLAILNRVHKLTPKMPAPAKPVILTHTKNKIQLNAMLVEGPLNSDYYTNATQKHTLTTAVVSDVPVEIVDSVRIDRHDLCSTHEEADIIITQRAISCSLSGKCIRVVCDDTDVLVLLVHVYHIKCRGRNSAPMIMSSQVKELAVIDIDTTATAHSAIADDLLAIHGFSGADTVVSLHGIGKSTVIKIAKKGTLSLSKVGDVKADIKSVQAQATKFICVRYGKVAEPSTSMTECLVKTWLSKTGKSGAPSVKLCSLPPTNDSFVENINRYHLQVATWKAVLLASPSTMDPTSHGWELDHQGILLPRTVPTGTLSAPAN